MLQVLRDHSSKWYVKAFLGFLALCFVLGGGIFDIFSGGVGAHDVAKIGKVKISDHDFYRALKLETRRLEPILGEQIQSEQILKLGIDRLVLNRLVQEAWLDQEADRLKLAVNDSQVYNFLSHNKNFHDKDGAFDPRILQKVLEDNHLSEANFVAKIKADMKRAQLIEALMPPMPMPVTMADPLYRWEHESRDLEVVFINASALPEPTSKPDEKTLQDFYDKHPSQFTLPETRNLTVALITTGNDQDTAIKDTYDKSRQLEDELASGATLEEAAKKLSLTIIKLTGVTADGKSSEKTSLSEDLLPEVVREGFATTEGSESSLNETKNGSYYIVRVDAVTPQHQQPFKEGRTQAEKLWSLTQKQEAARKLAENIVKEAKEGKSLKTLAAAHKLSFKNFSGVSRQMNPKETTEIPNKVRQILFTHPLKTPAFLPSAEGFIVGQAISRNATDPSKDLKSFETFRNEQRGSLGNDIVTSYLQSLEVRYPVHINQSAIQALVKQGS